MSGYSQARSVASPDHWRRRIGGRWGATTTIRSPFKDHIEWVVTEKQHALFLHIQSFPDWSEARRAKMLGVSPKMVHHNIKVWLERGLLRTKSIGQRGLRFLQVRKDWLLGALSPSAMVERLSGWRNERTPVSAPLMERLRVMLA